MAWTKLKTTVVVGVGLLLATGATTITVNEIYAHRTYPWQKRPADGNELDHLPPEVRIVRAKESEFGQCQRYGKTLALGTPIRYVVAAAYDASPAHIVFPGGLPAGRYDFVASLPKGNEEALQKEVRKKFGLVGKVEVRTTDALLLRVRNPARLQTHVFNGHGDFDGPGGLQYGCSPLSAIGGGLEFIFEKPIVDETGLSGDYSLRFLANEKVWSFMESRIESVRQTLEDELEQDGLELVPTNMPLEMLVVKKG